MPNKIHGRVCEWLRSYGLTLLQMSLSLLFLYVGALKLGGISPYHPFFQAAFPSSASDINFLMGIVDVVIGILLFLPIIELPRAIERVYSRFALVLAMGYILAIVLTLLFSTAHVFSPVFPSLTTFGDHVIRTLVLLISVLFVMAHTGTRQSK